MHQASHFALKDARIVVQPACHVQAMSGGDMCVLKTRWFRQCPGTAEAVGGQLCHSGSVTARPKLAQKKLTPKPSPVSTPSAASLIKCHGFRFPPLSLTPSKLEAPPIAPICKPVIGSTYSTTTALGLGGRQRAVRLVNLESRSIRGEVVELAFTCAQHTL